MRKTRAHPPKDHKAEDLRHYRRVIREAVRALDEFDAPRWQDGIELTLAGRIRMLRSNFAIEAGLLRGALHDALATSSAPLDRSASSGAAAPALSVESLTSEQRETAVDGSPVRAARRLDG
jgi:hypothetical protein